MIVIWDFSKGAVNRLLEFLSQFDPSWLYTVMLAEAELRMLI